MRWIKMTGAMLAAMGMASLAEAGLLSGHRGLCGASKACCTTTCAPVCCKPVIVKPCCPTIHTYQRRCSDIKPPCCDSCCAPASSCHAAPAANCAPACAAPAANCAPACAAPAANCAPACAAPAANCAPACAAPAANCGPASCGTTAGCGTKSCLTGFRGLRGLFSKHCKTSSCTKVCDPGCAAPSEAKCCSANPCDIACLIYESQTACYARQRRAAIRKLGNRYDCICNPEIMTAFVYALNDSDHRVRRQAADKIGDQIRKNCCCCPEVVAALTCALGDCDHGVVRQATQALRLCGYEVVSGNCNSGCATACNSNCTNGGCTTAPAMMPSQGSAAPAPVPPEEKKAQRRSSLSTLLGMLN